MGYLSTSCLRYPMVIIFIISIYITNVHALGRVFNMKMKPKVVSKFSMHGANRTHGPAPMDFHLGGNDSIWSYFTELSIGTPPQLFTVLIDTGSDITWLNCQNCDGCAIDDDENGVHLKPYNPEASRTAEILKHDCKTQADPNSPCTYNMSFLDGTVLSGYLVKDYLNYNRVTGDHHTRTGTTKFIFGCTMKQVSNTSMSLLDKGINGQLGMGTRSTTLLSQMSKAGSARNVFSMCLDRKRGGGIFAVGKLVNPKVEMVPFADNIPSYGLAIQSMTFGDDVIALNGTPTAILDTGSDISTLPTSVQAAIANLISKKLLVIPIQYFARSCFSFTEKVQSLEYFDTILPTLTFKFSNTVSMSVPPRNYMHYDWEHNRWCISSSAYEYDLFILGASFLSEKLIVYDNENKSIGLMDYDCSSSVEVEDDGTGEAFDVDSHVFESHV